MATNYTSPVMYMLFKSNTFHTQNCFEYLSTSEKGILFCLEKILTDFVHQVYLTKATN
jgi:hypothetical protein